MVGAHGLASIMARPVPPGAIFSGRGDFESLRERPLGRRDRLRVALLAPLSGPAGLWGPSCLTSATLAARQINAKGGVVGRELELAFVDAGRDPAEVSEDTLDMVEAGEAQAVVGMHISAVRQALVRALRGRIPYVYTPVYEGGETAPGVFLVGETPALQLKPSIAWLAERRAARRWYFIGNDYVWPHVSHRAARRYVKASGGEIVGESFAPFDCEDYSFHLDRIRAARADAVLVSMVGNDCVSFNRAFAEAGLAPHMLRLSAASEENTLFGIGAENAENLYFAAGYLAGLDTPGNAAFLDGYHAAFGARRAGAQHDRPILLRGPPALRRARARRPLARGGRAGTGLGGPRLFRRARPRRDAQAPSPDGHLSRRGGRARFPGDPALPAVRLSRPPVIASGAKQSRGRDLSR